MAGKDVLALKRILPLLGAMSQAERTPPFCPQEGTPTLPAFSSMPLHTKAREIDIFYFNIFPCQKRKGYGHWLKWEQAAQINFYPGGLS